MVGIPGRAHAKTGPRSFPEPGLSSWVGCRNFPGNFRELTNRVLEVPTRVEEFLVRVQELPTRSGGPGIGPGALGPSLGADPVRELLSTSR